MTEEQMKSFEEKVKNMSPEELQEFQKQQCIFCQIISEKVPSKKVYEDNKCVAILDINPAVKGHLLLIPKEHYAIMPQVPEEILEHLFLVSRTISQILLKSMRVQGTNIFIANGLAAGQKAQHFMVHLIPRKEGDGIIELENKLIDQEMQTKIHSLVQMKLNEMLGIKKEVQKELPTKSEEKEILAIKEATIKNKEKESPTTDKTEEPKEKINQTTKTKDPGKKEKVIKKKVTKKKGPVHKITTEEVEEAVTLDDIANLFR